MFADRWLERTKEGKCCQSKRKIVKESLTRKRRERSGGSSLMLFSHSLTLYDCSCEKVRVRAMRPMSKAVEMREVGGEGVRLEGEGSLKPFLHSLRSHMILYTTCVVFSNRPFCCSLSLSLSNLSHSLSFFEPDYSRRQQPAFAQKCVLKLLGHIYKWIFTENIG